jgi:multisubunit Na+/H+ antiporter MnhB subunit
MPKVPYTSVTETVARILSLLITLLCFSIYILSKDTQFLVKIDWAMLMVHLAIFWLAYEVFSFCFFLLLQQFALTKNIEIKQIDNKTNDKLPNIAVQNVEPIDDFDK